MGPPMTTCPPWCVTSAEEHENEDPGSRLHEGPTFGLIRTWWLEGPTGTFTATVTESPYGELSADDLRQLATDTLDAAMWMDRQASSGTLGQDVSVVELVRRAHRQATRSA